MKKTKRDFLNTAGVVIAQQTSVPIDFELAKKERELEKRFGRTAFGTRIPEKYFNVYPDDSQSRLTEVSV